MKTVPALLLLVSAAIRLHANLLVNGSFEAPGYDDSLGVLIGTGFYREMPAGSTAIDGWTITGPNPAVNWDKLNSAQGQDGTYSLFFGPNGNVGGTISQTFPTVAGQTYNVSLVAACGAGAPVLQLSADGQSANFDIVTQLPTTTWQRVSWQFIADDSQATLALSKVSNGPAPSFGFELDAVLVEVAQPVPAPAGLVAWWRAENDARDTIGDNHGALLDGVGFAAGKVGSAFSFAAGIKDRLRVPASHSLDVGRGGGLTIEVWVKVADLAAAQPVIEWNDEGGNFGAQLWVQAGGQLFGNLVDTTGTYHILTSANGLVTPGAWHHLALAYDKAGGTARLGYDGTWVTESVVGSFIPQTSFPISSGVRPNPGTPEGDYGGQLDELSIYNRALSAAEITAIFEAGAAGKTLVQPPVPPESLFVGNIGDNTIHRFSVSGEDLGVFARTGLNNPHGLAFDRSGNLYVVNLNAHTIRKFAPDGTDLGNFASTGPNQPLGIAVDRRGNVYVGYSPGNRIVKFGPDGSDQGTFAQTGLRDPAALAFDATGNLYVANYGDNTVHKFGPDGADLGVFASAGLHQPTGLAFDRGGNLYVGSSADNAIRKYSPDGADLGVFATAGLNFPAGVAFDSAGNLYVGNGNGNTVRRFSPTGADLGVFASSGVNVPRYMAIGGGPVPPEITVQPQSRTNLTGTTATFSVTATGTEPLTYRWRKGNVELTDGERINGATTATLTITEVQPTDAGDYTVVVSNGAGSVTSNAATLTVNEPQPVPAPPGLVAWWRAENDARDAFGSHDGEVRNGAGFTAGKVGEAFLFDGQDDYIEVPDQPDLRLPNEVTIEFWAKRNRLDALDLVLVKGGDWVTSVGGEANYGVGLHNINGRMFYFSFKGGWRGVDGVNDLLWHHYAVVAVNGQANPSFYIDGIPRPTQHSDGAATINLFPSTKALHLGAQVFPGWNYFGKLALDEVAIYNRALSATEITALFEAGAAGKALTPPAISAQPDSRTNLAGTTATFGVAATGTNPRTYRWRKGNVELTDGGRISGATTATLAITEVKPTDAGDYTVIVSNAASSVTSSPPAVLTIIEPSAITQQPTNVLAAEGQPVTLRVTATGTEPLSYQWQFNDVNLPGETGATLALTGIRTDQAGTYRVVVSNAGGSVTSSNAAVTVVTLEPAGLTVPAGADARFTATAYGEPPASYRWQFNGGALGGVLPGETSAVLIRANAQPSHSGTYRVTVKDAAGRAVALLARLQVDRPETPANPVAVTGWNRDFVLEASGTPQPGNFGGGDWFEAGWSGHVDGLPQSRKFTSAANPNVTFLLQPYAGNDALFFAFRQTRVLTLLEPARLATLHLLAVSAGGNDQVTVQLEFTDGTRSAPLTFGAPDWWTTRPEAGERHIAIDGLGRLFGGRYDGAEPFGMFETDLDLAALGLDRKAIRSLSFTKPVLGAGTETAVFAVSGTPAAALPERVLRITGASATPGVTVQLPVELGAVGDENTVAFSLRFDPAVLTYQGVANGGALPAGAQVVVNGNEAAAGRIGVLLALPQGQTFAAGSRELVRVSFQVADNVPDSKAAAVSFGDQPVTREVVSAGAEILPATYADAAVNITVGFEGDVSPRPGGDRRLSAADWTLVGRFAAGLTAIPVDAEFQRIDCAPRTTRGDGRVTAVDWTQAGRYVAGLDPAQTAGGPVGPVAGALVARAGVQPQTPATERQLRLLSASASAGSVAVAEVELQALGDENTLGFSVTFDPAVLNYQSANRGADLGPDALLVLNDQNVAEGRLGVLLALPSGQSFTAGTRHLLELRFNVPATVSAGSTPLAFGDAPIEREIVSPDVDVLPAEFLGATVAIKARAEFVPGTARIAAGRFEAAVRAAAGASIVLEYSEDLEAWTPLRTFPAGDGSLLLTDETAPPDRGRFYRLRTE